MNEPRIEVVDWREMPYAEAHARQSARVDELLASRESASANQTAGTLFLVEHRPAVITMTRRSGPNLLASRELLAARGIEVAATDRGGDITYHGPGQLVAYPVLDLNRFHLNLHSYMRLLEQSVIRTLARWDIPAERDAGATGVWVPSAGKSRKICAMGVRIRKWVSMHGLALNVNPDLSHYSLIVPCGIADRGVTSMAVELAARHRAYPSMDDVKAGLADELRAALGAHESRMRMGSVIDPASGASSGLGKAPARVPDSAPCPLPPRA